MFMIASTGRRREGNLAVGPRSAMPKWLLAPRIFGLAWRGLVHRGGWTATDFLAGKWPRWRTSWPTAWRQIALRRLVLAHALPALVPPQHDVAPPGSPLGGAYDVIPTRNLFDTNRSDAKNVAAIVETLPPAAALALYGVVISEDTRLAYLEDPATKRIAGYKIGDRLAGGQVERIEPDRVVILRAGGLI